MNAFFIHKFSSSFFVWFVATCRKRNAAVRMRGLNENINIFNKKKKSRPQGIRYYYCFVACKQQENI